MKFVTRAEWNAKPPRFQLVHIDSAKGVKVHYMGTAVPASLARPENHGQCDNHVRKIQADHLANTEENYSDIAYNAVVCPHGFVFEGRGAHRKTGANGDQSLNKAHYAVCALLGDSGLTEPTDAMLDGLRDAIEWLRKKGGAGHEIKGHRDGFATACPGKPLYRWVRDGAPRPGGESGEHPAPGRPLVDLSRLVTAARTDPSKQGTPVSYRGVAVVEAALVEEGLLAASLADGHYGTATVDAYAGWQRSLGLTGADADGIPGATSLRRLAEKHGFNVQE
ncbi:N-acetylmuramoyl-L-alanine amidase [Streptomyces luteolifulvus]|uniref:N-acetylmuramoyl-L-alanine amidase n=1 Tax=Streptomyces luteolifulvus TaxID=2615112 RepID=A0A6H9URD6_9ACTN|nr:N-acetylmuramoyl-L-alanine amidase [Streptomyces luteolifulvus]KAB1141522.1 N-acetylmuramoyl-L-alanine amidase [Streptomyces luteolifulvus]